MIKRDEQTKEYLGIACNICGADAPSTKEIMAAHGLNRMGWDCHGGTHLCPDCTEKESK